MSPLKAIKLPPITPSQKQSLQISKEGQEGGSAGAGDVSVQPAARNWCWTGSSYMYAGRGRKPQLLKHLESHVNKELPTISCLEPTFQELKLQVYRDVFCCFIEECKTYRPLLSAIRKEYENTIAYQQAQIRELEPLRSHLKLMTQECDRKIQSRWAEEQEEISALKREKHQLQHDLEAMREKEKATQAVVERVQCELSSQYVQYREERHGRKLLIRQLNHLTTCSVKEENPGHGNAEEARDCVELQLALQVCREDLSRTQEELTNMKAEYWDVVPRRNWDTLEQTHKHTVLQLKTLQGDFDQLKSEYDILLEFQKRDNMRNETHDPITEQTGESASRGQSQILSNQLEETIESDATEGSTLTVQEFRADLKTVFPLKSDQDKDELEASAQSKPASTNDIISSQRRHSILAESGGVALPPVLEESEENAA